MIALAAIGLLGALVVLIALGAHQNDADRRERHKRLLVELRRQPHDDNELEWPERIPVVENNNGSREVTIPIIRPGETWIVDSAEGAHKEEK